MRSGQTLPIKDKGKHFSHPWIQSIT